jgi:DNA-binding response OmpR family regulator
MSTHNGTGRREVHLTQKEQDLLDVLESNPGKCFSRPYLLKTVWGYADETKTRTVDVHVSRLRKKLRDKKNMAIHSIVGQGYVLQSGGKSSFGSSVSLPLENDLSGSAAHA